MRLRTQKEWEGRFVMYRYGDADGRLLYIGATKNVARRDADHRAGGSGAWWYPMVAKIRIQLFPTMEAALEAERLAIAEEQPAFNKHGTGREFGDDSHWTKKDRKALLAWHRRPGNYVNWWRMDPLPGRGRA